MTKKEASLLVRKLKAAAKEFPSDIDVNRKETRMVWLQDAINVVRRLRRRGAKARSVEKQKSEVRNQRSEV